jgi:hypothetical protein
VTRLFALALVLAATAVSAGICAAHGARCDVIAGAAAIKAYYDNGSPMAFCDTEIFRPGDDSEAFHMGSTDCHGTFGFVPDTTGTWKVTVDDGMGHMARAEVVVGPDRVSGGGSESVGRAQGVIVGVAVIFGLFGVLALFYCRRKERAKPCT